MPQLTTNEYDALVLTLSWIIGFIPIYLRRPNWKWVSGIGLAMLISPFVRMAIDIYLTIGALFVFTVLQPVSQEALWHSVGTRLLWYLVVPGLGLLLLHGMWHRNAREAGEEILRTHGLAPKASWRRDAQHGLALFFAIAIAYVAAYGVDRLIPQTVAGGDETQYWRNVTLPLIILLSATAGLTEEFLFRGVMLKFLSERMPWIAAATAQALFFALTHSGYGTWTHVLAPLAFGLGMAWVTRVLGLLPAALLHAQVNVLFFALDVAPDYVAARGVSGALALGGLVLAMTVASAWALRATKAEAVRSLWRSLRKRFADVGKAPTN
ncbi:MAG: CPBP family intramembrane glutamic endopeptidase [Candidatus Thermoplasmatota archaeon]